MIGSCLIVELLGILVSKVLEKQPTIYTLSRYGFAFIFLFLVEVLSSATLIFRHLKYVQFNIKYHCMY